MDWRYILEMANGIWTIVSVWLVIFLAYHLIMVSAQRRIWRRGLKIPLSIQLAIGIWIVCIGVLVTRAVVWVSRFSNDSFIELRGIETVSFVCGTLIGLAGFMCILRVITRPMLGQWPWLSAMGCCVIYVIWSVIRIL